MKKTILVVDDLETIRQVLVTLLDRLRFESLTATNGEEALAIVAEGKINLVITDLLMPGRDGMALIGDLANIPTSPPVIVFSGNYTPDQKEKALSLGAHAFLPKPCKKAELQEAIKSVLG
ncbi:MAG: response regulator [Candidatus Lindowbacteria bacterium]|nr:response regulator [Candidatus Lindowbacteria bacterium]